LVVFLKSGVAKAEKSGLIKQAECGAMYDGAPVIIYATAKEMLFFVACPSRSQGSGRSFPWCVTLRWCQTSARL